MASMGGFPGQDRTHEFNVYARAVKRRECWQCHGTWSHEDDCTFAVEDHDDDPLKG